VEKLIEVFNQSQGTLSSTQILHHGGVESSHSMAFNYTPLSHEIHIPNVEVNKFDGSDPMGWVTQMEHYLSLHEINNDLIKIHMSFLYLDPK
jgi:hypothetical protein